MKICWLDVRDLGERKHAAIEEAVHQRVDAIVNDDVADLAGVPPIAKRVLLPGGELPDDLGETDLVLVDPAQHGSPARLEVTHDGVEFGTYVEIVDAESLELACEAARTQTWTLMYFKDPTKIPLEIVLAAAAGASGSTVTQVADVEEAGIVFGVLEHGSDGVMLTARDVGDATALRAVASAEPGELVVMSRQVVQPGDGGCFPDR